MTDRHRATPEQWAQAEQFAAVDTDSACLLELRARVEALEAAQRLRFIEVVSSGMTDEEREQTAKSLDEPGCLQRISSLAPAASLVERVIDAIAYEHNISPSWKKEAHAAIREIAAWLDALPQDYTASANYFADMLREEVAK